MGETPVGLGDPMNFPVKIVTDYLGRNILGEVEPVASNPDTLILNNPVILRESQAKDSSQVGLTFMPVFHTFDVPQITVQWATMIEANDQLVSTYQDIVTKIKASRSGIELATKIPTQVS
jgi:hypothetical protein